VYRSLVIGFVIGSLATLAVVFSVTPADLRPVFAAPGVPDAAQPAKLGEPRTYDNTLTPIKDAKPLLADFPQFVEPVIESRRFEAPRLVDDPGADLDVRAWRWSYNARGIIEMANRLNAKDTAVIMVHPWAVDDEWG
jgi:hypothetical protein